MEILYNTFEVAKEAKTIDEAFNILNTLTTEEIEMLFKDNNLEIEGLRKEDKIEALMYYTMWKE